MNRYQYKSYRYAHFSKNYSHLSILNNNYNSGYVVCPRVSSSDCSLFTLFASGTGRPLVLRNWFSICKSAACYNDISRCMNCALVIDVKVEYAACGEHVPGGRQVYAGCHHTCHRISCFLLSF